jgi:hypothetical protein
MAELTEPSFLALPDRLERPMRHAGIADGFSLGDWCWRRKARAARSSLNPWMRPAYQSVR